MSAPRPLAAGGFPSSLQGRVLLLVEDDADLREVIAEELADEGARVRAVGSAEEALAALDGVDAVISDIGLSGTDGIAFMRELRARGCSLPALALTGWTGEGERDAVLAAGYQSYLTKPVTPEGLVAEIVRLLTR